jgi:hypothetical protein
MKLSSVSVSMAAVAVLAAGVALWPANAQPTGDKPVGGQPPAGEKGGRPTTPGPRGGDRTGEPPSEWREKYKDEVRQHPRLGRSLVAMHEAKDYLEKATGDFGGHKKASVDALDAAIKEVEQAMKCDEKRDDSKGRPPRGDQKPSGDKPAPTTPKP